MDDLVFSILLVVLGLLIGLFIAFVINSIRVSVASKKIASLREEAKKEIEKMKRDAALEQKEEAHKLKMDLDKEIREKKEEIRKKKKLRNLKIVYYKERLVLISEMNCARKERQLWMNEKINFLLNRLKSKMRKVKWMR